MKKNGLVFIATLLGTLVCVNVISYAFAAIWQNSFAVSLNDFLLPHFLYNAITPRTLFSGLIILAWFVLSYMGDWQGEPGFVFWANIIISVLWFIFGYIMLLGLAETKLIQWGDMFFVFAGGVAMAISSDV